MYYIVFHCSLYKNLLLFVFNLVATQESQLLQPPRPRAIWFHSCQSCTCLLMSWTVSICHTSWHKFCYKIKNVSTYLHSNMPSMSALELSPKTRGLSTSGWMVCQLSSTMLIPYTSHIKLTPLCCFTRLPLSLPWTLFYMGQLLQNIININQVAIR